MKKFLILLFSIIFFCSFAVHVSAAGLNLEVSYPQLIGVITPTMTASPLVLYLVYIYQLSILGIGFLISVIFFIGGWRYLFSTGNPSKKLDAKKQITGALLGFVIILGSYMILNTISPGLVRFPDLLLEKPTFVNEPLKPDALLDNVNYNELPLGALITSEYGASSFFSDATPTDADATDIAKYSIAFPEEKSYNSRFQGALHGRRLKRILETASSTQGTVELIDSITEDIVVIEKAIKFQADALYDWAFACKCLLSCMGITCIPVEGGACPPTSCNNGGYVCGLGRAPMKEIQEHTLPDLYPDSDTSPLNCRFAELEYTSIMLTYFATTTGLVDNQDYPNLSFSSSPSPEIQELRTKVENCNQYLDEIDAQKLILSTTENKGNWSPTSTIPQRDIASNLDELKKIYNTILDVKDKMDPYGSSLLVGELSTYMQLQMALAQTQTFDPNIQPEAINSGGDIIVHPYPIIFDDGSSIKELLVQKYSGDPAAFYYLSTPEETIISKKNNIFEKIISYFSNLLIKPVSAADDTDVTAGLELNKTVCTPLVEIPIGKATDEALKLTKDIITELSNMQENIFLIPDFITEAKENQQKLNDAADELIDVTTQCRDKTCLGNCSCNCMPTCNCFCFESSGPICPGLETAKINFEIAYVALTNSLNKITDATDKIVLSYKRLNSEKIDDKTFNYLGEDVCCLSGKGGADCRPENDPNSDSMTSIENMPYTLREKLATVQLLLNRSREISPPIKGSKDKLSDYQILYNELQQYKDLKPIAYNVSKLKTSSGLYIPWVGSGDVVDTTTPNEIVPPPTLLDLSNCGYRIEELDDTEVDQEDEKQNLWTLMNSAQAKGEGSIEIEGSLIDPLNRAQCVPDPLLDCFYDTGSGRKTKSGKNVPTRNRAPYNCYSHIDGIEYKKYPAETRIPEGGNLASNMYCCVEAPDPQLIIK
jgi:hypothetical protein